MPINPDRELRIPDQFRAALEADGGWDMTARLVCADWIEEHLDDQLLAQGLRWSARNVMVPIWIDQATGDLINGEDYVGGYNWIGHPVPDMDHTRVAVVPRTLIVSPNRYKVLWPKFDTIVDALDALLRSWVLLDDEERQRVLKWKGPNVR